MAKKHDIWQLAAWAKDWGLSGFEHCSHQQREKANVFALKQSRQKDKDNQKWQKQSYGKSK